MSVYTKQQFIDLQKKLQSVELDINHETWPTSRPIRLSETELEMLYFLLREYTGV